jgi:hypothetical protein
MVFVGIGFISYRICVMVSRAYVNIYDRVSSIYIIQFHLVFCMILCWWSERA